MPISRVIEIAIMAIDRPEITRTIWRIDVCSGVMREVGERRSIELMFIGNKGFPLIQLAPARFTMEKQMS